MTKHEMSTNAYIVAFGKETKINFGWLFSQWFLVTSLFNEKNIQLEKQNKTIKKKYPHIWFAFRK